MRGLSILLMVVISSGCATLSQEDCSRGDWFGVGLVDGRAGNPVSLLYQHQKACAEFSIVVDEAAYFAGRQQGLDAYCQIDNAFENGLSGRQYRQVCPAEIDVLYQRYHDAGFRVHQARSNLDRLDGMLSGKEKALQDGKLKDKDRKRIRREIKMLDRKRERLLDDLYFHQRRFDDLWREAHPSY